jgi:C-terminal processing protease CtpA/Prc
MKKTLLFSLLIAAALAAWSPAQNAVDKKAAIDALEKAMLDRYVDEPVAKQAMAKVRAKLDAKGYDSITTGAEFAKALTDDLNSVCKDAHLRVRYSETVLPQRQRPSEPTPEEVKRQQEWLRLANAGFEEVKRLPGNVGYLRTVFFADGSEMERQCAAAFDFLANTDAMILDLRDNGGGSPDGVRHLCSYFFSEKSVHLNDLYFREGNRTEEFWTLESVKGARYLNKPVYVIVSKRTGSGAEECTYNLLNLKRATIVGENTWGGANPGGVVRLNDHFSAFIPTGKAINPYTKTNWEGTGVTPDVKVDPKEALATAHKLILEGLLEKATTAEDKKRLTDALKSVTESK